LGHAALTRIYDDVANVVRSAIPVKAEFVSVLPADLSFQSGEIQINLF
jgi:hypothetical protein